MLKKKAFSQREVEKEKDTFLQRCRVWGLGEHPRSSDEIFPEARLGKERWYRTVAVGERWMNL
jgi:hypothetical protein